MHHLPKLSCVFNIVVFLKYTNLWVFWVWSPVSSLDCQASETPTTTMMANSVHQNRNSGVLKKLKTNESFLVKKLKHKEQLRIKEKKATTEKKKPSSNADVCQLLLTKYVVMKIIIIIMYSPITSHYYKHSQKVSYLHHSQAFRWELRPNFLPTCVD